MGDYSDLSKEELIEVIEERDEVINSFLNCREKRFFDDPMLSNIAVALDKFEAPVLITDSNPENPKVMYVNNGFTSMTGYTLDEIKGKNPKILQGEKTSRSVLDKLKTSLVKGEHFHDTAINYKKDGTEFYNQWGIEPIINSKGEITNFISIHNDVTPLKQREEELKRSKKDLEDQINQKNQFFSILAHDLRNPLNGFITMTDLIGQKYMDLSMAKLIGMISKLNSSAKELNELLSNLLNWSRVRTGQIELNKVDQSIRDVVTKVVSLLTPQADSKNISISTSIKPKSYAKIDSFVVDTVLRNLISNAIKFTNNGGEIKISFNDEGIISVQDNGIGMDQNTQDALFNFSNRSSSLGTNNEKGTGLGLKLCKDIAMMHGGDLKVSSELGKGSRFDLILDIN